MLLYVLSFLSFYCLNLTSLLEAALYTLFDVCIIYYQGYDVSISFELTTL